MKLKRAAIALTLAYGAFAGVAQGQGLLSLGENTDDFEQEDIPLRWTINGAVGWDSNINSSQDEEDSMYVQAGIGTQWAGGSRITRYTLGASASVLYYFEDVTIDDNENWYYAVRLQGSFAHRASRQLTITDSFYVTYEYEPNQFVGSATSARTDQYFYFYNNFTLSYAWTRRFSTVANYAVSGIFYDDSESEDRITQVLGAQARYALTRQTTLVGEYRFAYTDYDQDAPGLSRDYHSHYVLAGVDHAFDRHTTGMLRVGAEFRDYDDFSSSTNPYVEASLIQELNEGFRLRWLARYGMEDGELSGLGYEERIALRMGLIAEYEFDPRLKGTAGLTYVHSEYNDNVIAGISDADEDYFGISLGLSYLIYSNVSLDGGYSFTTLDSDMGTGFRDYDRHRVWVGVSATF